MVVLDTKIKKYKNINIIQEKTDKNFNLYTLINNKNSLLNDITFKSLNECKLYIDTILNNKNGNEVK